MGMWTLLMTLVGCGGEPSEAAVVDTPLKPRVVTTAAGCTWATQSVGGLLPSALLSLPTGEVLAVSDHAARLRRLDGTWHYDPQVFPLRTWSGGATDRFGVWQVSGDEVHRRDLIGRWRSWVPEEYVFLWRDGGVEARPDGVTLAEVGWDPDDGWEFSTDTMALDGTWSFARGPAPSSMPRVLPHPAGGWIGLGGEAVWHGDEHDGFQEVALDGVPIHPYDLYVAADGTLLVLDQGQVWLGTVEAGLHALPLPEPAPFVTDAWLGSADDVWAMESMDAPDVARFWHFDGTAWTEVPAPGRRLHTFTVVGGRVIAVGQEDGQLLVASGDAGDGIVVEREEPLLDGIDALAVDDVEGSAWGVEGGALLSFVDAWALVDRLEDAARRDQLAVSGGRRLVHRTGGSGPEVSALQVVDVDGSEHGVELPDGSVVWASVGSNGALHAVGGVRRVDTEPLRPTVWSSPAPGQALVEVELTGLPDGATVDDALATSDGMIWLTWVGDDGTWALGTLTDGRVNEVDAPVTGPLTLTGGGAGPGFVVQSDEVARAVLTLDDGALRDVPELPDHVRAAHAFPDGSWLLVMDLPDDRVGRRSLEHLSSDGVREVLDPGTLGTVWLEGHGERAWFVGDGRVAHTLTCP